MSPIAVALLAFALMLLAILVGGFIQGKLPEGHLTADAKEVVKLSMGIMGTLAALVLGLLIANAQSSFAARQSEINQLTANVILLDTLLKQYGDDAHNARLSLRNAIPRVADRIWREGQSAEAVASQSSSFQAAAEGEGFYQQIQNLAPSTDNQREIRDRLLQVTVDTAQERFLLFSHLGSSIPAPFLVVLLFWLAVLFASFALLARPNATTLASLIVCALSVSGAIFLILELDEPFSGFMSIDSEPLLHALPALS
jgi:Protein of unknown function (DUF4239)